MSKSNKYATRQTVATTNVEARKDLHTSVMSALEAAKRGARALAGRHLNSAHRDLAVNHAAGLWTFKGAGTMTAWLNETEKRCAALKG